MTRPDPVRTRAWVNAGTAALLGAVDRLDDAALTRRSVRPGLDRAGVMDALVRDAQAAVRLANWARTGAEPLARESRGPVGIGPAGAGRRDPSRLRADLRSTAEALDAAMDRLDARAWRASVRVDGRAVPAGEIPWRRARAVWLGAVDLDAGVGIGQLPTGVVDVLLDDVTAVISGRVGAPGVTLAPDDRERRWCLGVGRGPGRGEGIVVSGTAASLAGWLTGRTGGTDLWARAGLDTVPVPGVEPVRE